MNEKERHAQFEQLFQSWIVKDKWPLIEIIVFNNIALFEFGSHVFHIQLISNHVMVVVMLVKCNFLIVIVSWYQVKVFFPFSSFVHSLWSLITLAPCDGCVGNLGHMQALSIDLLMSIYTLGLWHMGVDSSQNMFFVSKETINPNQLHMKNYLHQDLIWCRMYVNHF
jgi:hypothetical protein